MTKEDVIAKLKRPQYVSQQDAIDCLKAFGMTQNEAENALKPETYTVGGQTVTTGEVDFRTVVMVGLMHKLFKMDSLISLG